MPFLPAETMHVHNREAKDLDLIERFFDRFKFRRLDDGEDEFHAASRTLAATRDRFGFLS
jgi:hypothetical protein